MLPTCCCLPICRWLPTFLLLLQASVGLMLPTLMVWRAQLELARRHASGQRGQRRAREGGPHRPAQHDQSMAEAEAELASSEYGQVCLPVMQAAAGYGFAVIIGLAALLAFAAALMWQSKSAMGVRQCSVP